MHTIKTFIVTWLLTSTKGIETQSKERKAKKAEFIYLRREVTDVDNS